MIAAGLDEGRRQAYLAALGIPLWSAQQALPGAQDAEPLGFQPWLFEGDVFVAEAAGMSEGAGLEPGPTVDPIAEAKPAAGRPVEVREPALNSPTVKATSPAEAARAALSSADGFPRFSFLLRSYEGWQLIISLGEAPDLSSREHALLAQIESVLAVTGGGSQTHFRWPLNNNPAIPRDAQAAREAVGAFMRRAQQAGGRYLLLGHDLHPYLATVSPLIQGASLAELLDQPLLKRELWRSLAQAGL